MSTPSRHHNSMTPQPTHIFHHDTPLLASHPVLTVSWGKLDKLLQSTPRLSVFCFLHERKIKAITIFHFSLLYSSGCSDCSVRNFSTFCTVGWTNSWCFRVPVLFSVLFCPPCCLFILHVCSKGLISLYFLSTGWYCFERFFRLEYFACTVLQQKHSFL